MPASGIFEGLITYKPGTWEVVNVLAETFEPSADGLQFAFKLKEGIQFHGGYGEVTAEDVKFSYERIAGLTKPEIDSPYKGDWAACRRSRSTDTYSGTIILKEPFAAAHDDDAARVLRLVLSKKAVEERGEEYATSPIGTGPYEFVEWKPKQQVPMQRFADYGGASSDILGTLVGRDRLHPHRRGQRCRHRARDGRDRLRRGSRSTRSAVRGERRLHGPRPRDASTTTGSG